MSTVRIGALGGLGEDGKNMYVVEVDERIFVLDAGLKAPSIALYGIDAVIPNLSYLVANRGRVQGLFLSHGHDEAIGAVPEFLKKLNVPVYGSRFTMALVESMLKDARMTRENYQLFRVTDDKTLHFGPVEVSFWNETHSLPGTLGIAIHTPDGVVAYATDFSFTSNANPDYQTNFDRISSLKNEGVLALLSESIGTDSVDRVTSDTALSTIVDGVLENSGRVIFAMFAPELQRVQKVIDLCIAKKRKIAFAGRRTQRILSVAMDTGFLKIPKEALVSLHFLDDTHQNDDPDLAVIIAGSRHEPYYMLQRIFRGQDKLMKISGNDHVVIISPVLPGIERLAQATTDMLATTDTPTIEIKKNQLRSSHADGEDLETLYTILKPRYILPIAGEYRHQYMQRETALSFGYALGSIIILEDGDFITFKAGRLAPGKQKAPKEDVLIDGSIVGDINETVMSDRASLASAGLIVAELALDSAKKSLLLPPRIEYRGFLSVDAKEELDAALTLAATDAAAMYFQHKYLSLADMKEDLRKSLANLVKKKTGKDPIVMVVALDRAGEDTSEPTETRPTSTKGKK